VIGKSDHFDIEDVGKDASANPSPCAREEGDTLDPQGKSMQAKG
jgi:hypothetical protein